MAILVIVAVLAIVGVVLARQLLWLVAAVLCLAVAISAAAYAITGPEDAEWSRPSWP